jgi:hypothetical protein
MSDEEKQKTIIILENHIKISLIDKNILVTIKES